MDERKIDKEFAYLESLNARGIRTDLTVMERALALMGDPHEALNKIVVGGTNGKGSVVSFIGSALAAAGYKPGLYYSPHIVDFRERIIVGSEMITVSEAASLINRVREIVDTPLKPTYFEFITLMAFVHFKDVGVNPAVMEVGLGGRFDAVNVGMPAVSVITNVSLDHTQYLGRTPEEIALEKVQILPEGGMLIVGRVDDSVRSLLKGEAEERGAASYFLGEDFSYDLDEAGDAVYRGIEFTLSDISIGLPGAHQAQNVAVALAVLEVLREMGYKVPGGAMKEGVGNIYLPGRMEVIARSPEVIVDVAHNVDAAMALVEHLTTLPVKKTAFVVGMMRDKDIKGFLKILDLEGEGIFLTGLNVPRAAGVDEMARDASCLKTPVRLFDNMTEALSAARDFAGEGGRVVVTGSFYTVEAAVRELGGL
ncbi:MAG: bifunctional folylpolyglutamate synthase/dihydrofolate synthase [Deltaproteobacteria bacterium]|uniref:tetrahydrofolate synthase n=1 Tax=Candidatus Zymogenus saltonus TaxID=2844893 RepID=A0A9D8KAD0_9DELT|nr:bifunctional folylpolyglutamate synthase/dihydrofolate synthase [Candidatus Zymogenus saltonus]